MSSTGISGGGLGAKGGSRFDQDVKIRQELDHLLASSHFQSSNQCQRFLRYVVERTLDGSADSIKEQVIGVEVFGKSPSYSPGEDAGVRVKAGEVRKRLRSYYHERTDKPSVVIDLPVGTYVPVFQVAEEQQPDAKVASATHSTMLWIGITLLAALVIAIAYVTIDRIAVPSSLAEFWSPVYSGKKTPLLCAAPVPVFARLRDPTKENPSTVDDFVPISDQFVAVGDLNAISQISEMFRSMRWPYKLHIANDVTFRDFRSTPVVLVGFSYTLWDDLNRGSRYSIDLGRRPFGILDRDKMTSWTIPTNPDDPQLADDYAIISRIFDQDTGNILIEMTGISHYGTEASAELVTNPEELKQILAAVPAGWQKRNLQIVLHLSIIANSPSNPRVVASYVW